jgi:hypothetical protein
MKALSKMDHTFLKSKAVQLLDDTLALVQQFPKLDPQDATLQTAMNEIRAKFKLLVASLGFLHDFYPRQTRETLIF